MLSQFLLNGLIAGGLIALMSVGFGLIYNTTRILHVALGASYTSAAYCCYFCLTRIGWSLSVSALVALLITALLGGLTELWVYAPLRHQRAAPLLSLLSSLGLYIVLVNVIALAFGNETQLLSIGDQAVYHLGGVVVTCVQTLQAIIPLCLLPLLLLLSNVTRLGRTIRAVRDNVTLASVMGADLRRLRLIVFALGSMLAGTAAILSALDIGVDPNVGLPTLLTAAVALIVGGVGSLPGTALGGLLIGLLQSLVMWRTSARWVDAVTFSLLVLFLLLRPEGLTGKRRRLEEAAG